MQKKNSLSGKRILFVVPGLELGGAERQALYLAGHLKKIGCDVRVWGFFGPGLAAKRCDEMGIPWAIHFFRWPCRKKSLPRVFGGFLKFLYALRTVRADIILSYCSWANISCGLLWKFTTAKVFVWGQRDLVKNCDILSRLAYRQATAIVCNAEHEIDFLNRTLGALKAPLFTVYNGVKLPQTVKNRGQWRSEFGVDESTPVITMLANFRFQKDHQTLLLAWRLVMEQFQESNNRPFLFLAGAKQESYPVAKQLATDLDLNNSVKFLGQIHDVSGLLKASDIGVLITPDEGLPNAVIEYMICGLPVIATDLPSTREVLRGNFEHQLCPPSNPKILAERIISMLNSHDLRQMLGSRNKQRAESEFAIEAMCSKSESIIKSLLANPQ